MKNKSKKILKNLVQYVCVTFMLIGIYIISMLLTSLIPSSWMKNNVKISSEILYKNDEKVIIDLKFKEETLFTFTDALMINTAYSIDSKNPASFMLARKNYIPGQTKEFYRDSQYNLEANEKYKNPKNEDIYETKELYGLMHGDNIEDSYEYARYWHGYLVLLRPLLAIFDYGEIRVFLALATLVCVCAILYLIYKKINLTSCIMFGIGLLAIDIFIVSQSINEILIFLVSFISTIILLLKYKKIKNIGIFFFIVGSISSFIDLLTAPLVTLGLPLIVYFLLTQKEEKANIKKYLFDILKIGISWCLGYGITWVLKWVLVELFFKRSLISQAIEQVLYRINGGHTKSLPTTLSIVTKRNIEYLSNNVVYFVLIIGFLNIIIRTLKILKNKEKIDIKENLKKCLPYLIIFFFPIIWYAVIKQHSFIHPYLTNRILVISIISLLILTNKILEKKKE